MDITQQPLRYRRAARSQTRSAGSFTARARTGFTLIELMVVISIIGLVALVFTGFMSGSYGGSALDAGVRELRAMVQRGRAQSLARNSRFELLVDYQANTFSLLERRPVGFFGFESAFGRYDLSLILGSGATIVQPWRPMDAPQSLADSTAAQTATMTNLMDGSALAIARGGSATIPWKSSYASTDDQIGVAVSFDLRPNALEGEVGTVISRGSQWNVRINKTERGSCELTASVGSTDFISDVQIPASSWSHIELVVSTIAPRLYVNHIEIPVGINSWPSANGDPSEAVTIGGAGSVEFWIDNLRLEELNAGRAVELDDEVRLIPPGVLGTYEELVSVYEGSVWEKADYLPYLSQADGKVYAAGTMDPSQPYPRTKELIYFNDRAELDMAFHPGSVRLNFIADVDGEYQVSRATIGVMGDIETEDRPMPPPSEELIPGGEGSTDPVEEPITGESASTLRGPAAVIRSERQFPSSKRNAELLRARRSAGGSRHA